MNYSYEIDHFNAIDGLLGVVYINNDDPRLSAILRRVGVNTSMTEADIRTVIEANVPHEEWSQEELIINGDMTTITSLINTTTSTTYTTPAEGVNIDLSKGEKITAIENLRENQIHQGVMYNGRWYRTGLEERTNLTATATAIANGISLPVGFTWTGYDIINDNKERVDVPMDSSDVVALSTLMFNMVNQCYVTARTHITAVEAMTDINDVEQYDITSGWPV